MKVGDRVRHKKKNIVGVVYEISKVSVVVDWSDDTGIMFRVSHIKDLEIINESR